MVSASGAPPAVADAACPQLVVVVPTYNRPHALTGLLDALARQTAPGISVCVVDHGSEPCAESSLRREGLGVELLRGAPELWWTGAVNVGLRHVLERLGGDGPVVLMNDDTTFDERFIEQLQRQAAQAPNALIAATCLHRETGKVAYAGLRLDRARARFVAYRAGESAASVPAGELYACDVLPGRGLLIPRRVFSRVGLLAERELPHYAADYEFSWRARRAGFDLFISSDARVITAERERWWTTEKRFRRFACDDRRPGNLPTVRRFARLCFSPGYAVYYTAMRAISLASDYALLRAGLA